MKALVKKRAEQGLWLEEEPVSEVGNNDVLIKIQKTAICGTDAHIYNWDCSYCYPPEGAVGPEPQPSGTV